jgi:hypothetical protein
MFNINIVNQAEQSLYWSQATLDDMSQKAPEGGAAALAEVQRISERLYPLQCGTHLAVCLRHYEHASSRPSVRLKFVCGV